MRGKASWPTPCWRALGLAAGFTNVGFNWAVTQGDVVRVVLLFYLMPLWSVLLGWLLLGERPTGGALARVALALTGVVVLKTPGTDWPVPSSLPDWLGLAAGFSFAVANIVCATCARRRANLARWRCSAAAPSWRASRR